jgi:hypothetical protein
MLLMISRYILLMQFNSHFLLFVTNHPSVAHIETTLLFLPTSTIKCLMDCVVWNSECFQKGMGTSDPLIVSFRVTNNDKVYGELMCSVMQCLGLSGFDSTR